MEHNLRVGQFRVHLFMTTKVQLISKSPFGVNQKTYETFVRISALASKKRSNEKVV